MAVAAVAGEGACVCVRPPGATAASLHQDVLLPLPGSAHWLAPVLSRRSGAPEMASFCPPPAPFPSPPFWLYLICCHLRTREQAGAPSSSIIHGRLGRGALAGLPAPAPHRRPAQSRRGPRGVRRGGQRKRLSALAPQTLDTRGGKLFASPRRPPPTGRRPDQKSLAVRGKWGGLLCPPHTFIFIVAPQLMKVAALCPNIHTLQGI